MIAIREEGTDTRIVLDNGKLRVEIAPGLGGKITSVYNQSLGREFLWHNRSLKLEKQEPGTDYDTNFWGGIDELIPNDIPEQVDGIDYPDHGELWTTGLDYRVVEEEVILSGLLPKSGLFYQKTVSLPADNQEIRLDYCIRNTTRQSRHFLWKLHAALQIAAGDQLSTSAKKGRIVYPGSSRFPQSEEFSWPEIEGNDTSVIPPKNGTMDFFYLYETKTGTMSMLSDGGNLRFEYRYDQKVFPYQWYFASYGQFNNHYTAILEPATSMPVSVNEAAALSQCSVLEPGEEIKTTVTIYAGENTCHQSRSPTHPVAGEDKSPKTMSNTNEI